MAAVTASGAAVGSTAVLPGLGTLAALSAAAGETAVFLEATAFYALATATVYGVLTEDRERRRALVLAVLVGDDSKQAMSELIGGGRTSGAWLSEGVASLPLPALSQLNSRLLKRAVRRFTLRRSALLFGKILPVGIGAVIGAVGNRMAGKKIVRNARNAFGRHRRGGRSTCTCCRRFPTRAEREKPVRTHVADRRRRVSLMRRPVGAAAGETRRHRCT